MGDGGEKRLLGWVTWGAESSILKHEGLTLLPECEVQPVEPGLLKGVIFLGGGENKVLHIANLCNFARFSSIQEVSEHRFHVRFGRNHNVV